MLYFSFTDENSKGNTLHFFSHAAIGYIRVIFYFDVNSLSKQCLYLFQSDLSTIKRGFFFFIITLFVVALLLNPAEDKLSK